MEVGHLWGKAAWLLAGGGILAVLVTSSAGAAALSPGSAKAPRAVSLAQPVMTLHQAGAAVSAKGARPSTRAARSGAIRRPRFPRAPKGAPEAIVAGSYAFAALNGVSLEDMSSGTTQLVAANQDDTASSVANIGFDYWYDGTRYTQFSVNANGLVRLGSSAVDTAFTNSLASTTDSPKIAAYWDDLWTGTNGKVHYRVLGSAPNRKLVIEWLNEQIPRVGAGNPGAGTFQAWLYESTGVIELVYGNGVGANSANGGYSVGLQSGAATNFASVTTAGGSVSYAAANDAQTNAVPAGTAYTFTPNVPDAPTNLTFTNVTSSSMQLNWADNASNEVGYAV